MKMSRIVIERVFFVATVVLLSACRSGDGDTQRDGDADGDTDGDTDGTEFCSDGTLHSTTGHCYKHIVPDDSISWDDAQALCQEWNGHLVSFDSEAECSFVKDQVGRDTHYWVGLTDSDEEGVFAWTDGTTFDPSLQIVVNSDNWDCCFLDPTQNVCSLATSICEAAENFEIVCEKEPL